MKKIHVNTLQEGIVKLQEYIDEKWHYPEKKAHGETVKRRPWLKAISADSYNNPVYRIELWVLQGTPVCQIVIINHEKCNIFVFDSNMTKELKIMWNSLP